MNCQTCGTPLYVGFNHVEPCPTCAGIIDYLNSQPTPQDVLNAINTLDEQWGLASTPVEQHDTGQNARITNEEQLLHQAQQHGLKTLKSLNLTDACCECQYDISQMSYLFGAFTVDSIATQVLPLYVVVATNSQGKSRLFNDYMKLTCLSLYAFVHNA